jgi:hypothetical protein
MLHATEVKIEVPPFNIPVILAFNAALWVLVIGVAAAVF